MRFIFLIPLLAIGLCTSAQTPHCLSNRYSQDALFDSTEIQVTTDVQYAIAQRWPSTIMDTLRMDIYQPDPNIDPLAERPLIVMTHGGSFAGGVRGAMAYYCMEMARRGFVTATVSYRLGWNCDFSTDPCLICQSEAWRAKVATYRAVQDNRAAIRHLVHNANTLGIDTAFIFLQGESAGSITSLNSAFWDQSEADDWCANCTSEVGLLDTSGNDLTETYSIKGVINHCGAVSHVDVMDGHQIPVVSFHNNPDCVVPYGGGQVMNCLGCAAFYWVSGSNAIQARLNTNGVCTQRHARSEILPNHCTYYTQPLLKRSACFLKGIMCDNCTSSNSDNEFSIPDCSDGGVVSTLKIEEDELLMISGDRVVFGERSEVISVKIFDLSMRLLARMSVSNSEKEVQLPRSLRGCMVVKVDSRDQQTKVLKWCHF